MDYDFFLDQIDAVDDDGEIGNIQEVEFVDQYVIGTWKTIPENPDKE